MVQYIPNAPGTTPYRQVNPSPLAFFSQGLGQGLPQLMQTLGNRVNPRVRQEKKQQDDFMNMTIGDLMKQLQPQPQQGPPNAPQQGPMAPGQTPQAPSSGIGGPPGPPNMNMRTMAMIQAFTPYLAHQVAQSLFPTIKPGSTRTPQPMVDTPWGPMTPYQAAGREQAGQRTELVKKKMGEEWARIQEGVATNTEREYQIAAGPLDQAAKDLKEIHQMRAKLPAGTTDEDLAKAWDHLIPKTGTVKDPIFGGIHPELKNYVSKVFALQQNLQKRAMNMKDPHAFTYQTLLNLVPTQKLPSLPEMDQNFKNFNSNVMAIKRTARQQAAAKYRLMGMQQFNTIQQQISSDPDLMQAPEEDQAAHDAVEAELYGG